MKKSMLGMVFAVVLGLMLPSAGWAHEGHVHKVLGTIASVQGNNVEVKTTAGKTVKVVCDDKTTVMRGKEKLDMAALKVGDRVSVDAMQDKDVMMAHAIKLGAVAKAK